MKRTVIALGLALGVASAPAVAQGFDQDNLYLGAGVSRNSLSGASNNPIGFQFFGGYKLDEVVNLDPVTFAVEVGYMDSGDFEVRQFGLTQDIGSASGLWVNAVFGYPLTPEVNLLGRIGLDFGDDDGLMLGFGAGYRLNPNVELRGEYVIRDDINSLQANFVYHF
jgi:hypothetical protein